MYAAAIDRRAWAWATCPDGHHRDGERAVESATRACELSGWKQARFIATLAAAHAEAGDFAKAVEYQRRANDLYAVPNDRARGEERLALYQDGKPYRDE